MYSIHRPTTRNLRKRGAPACRCQSQELTIGSRAAMRDASGLSLNPVFTAAINIQAPSGVVLLHLIFFGCGKQCVGTEFQVNFCGCDLHFCFARWSWRFFFSFFWLPVDSGSIATVSEQFLIMRWIYLSLAGWHPWSNSNGQLLVSVIESSVFGDFMGI